MTDYKTRHEQFVTGLSGSNVGTIYLVSSVILTGYVAWGLVMNKLPKDHWVTVTWVDAFYNWIMPLLAITAYSNKLWVLVLLSVGPPLMQRIVFGWRIKRAKKPIAKPKSQILEKVPFITVYRSSMMILTMTAILAVDFPIFPRKFAKVEDWGTSLMDLGVGSFVFSSGVVCARPVIRNAVLGGRKPGIKDALTSSSELLIIGLIRLVGVKLLNYQEHVSEYGVHWNFFITLGVLPLLVLLVQPLQSRIPQVITGVLIAIGYEIILKNTDLLEWALTAERTDLISKNKEGIVSLIGFLAIFLIGQAAGFFVLPSVLDKNARGLFPPGKVSRPARSILKKKVQLLVIYGTVFELLFRLFNTETPVSRKLANLPYVLWVCSYNFWILAVYAVASSLMEFPTSISMEGCNKRGQVMFLAANVLTGVVNMLFNTIDASVQKSLLVLVGYQGVLYALSLWLRG